VKQAGGKPPTAALGIWRDYLRKSQNKKQAN